MKESQVTLFHEKNIFTQREKSGPSISLLPNIIYGNFMRCNTKIRFRFHQPGKKKIGIQFHVYRHYGIHNKTHFLCSSHS